MGSDDEHWQPKPIKPKLKPDPNSSLITNQNNDINSRIDNRKPSNQRNISDYNNSNSSLNRNDSHSYKSSNTYHVSLNGDKRIVTASNLEEIIRNIRSKYEVSNSHQMRINYWSDEYHEWIFLDAFPPDKTKLQVILTENFENNKSLIPNIKTEQDLNAIIRHELTKYLEQPVNFSKHLNQTCKYCLDTNKQQDLLNYFETSVHYINKRYNQNHAAPTKQLLQLQDNQQKIIDKLISDTEALRQENRMLKQQLDDLSKEIQTFTEYKTSKKGSGGKTRCSIM